MSAVSQSQSASNAWAEIPSIRWIAYYAHPQSDVFGYSAPVCANYILIFSLCSCRMWRLFYMACINHQLFVTRFVNQYFQHFYHIPFLHQRIMRWYTRHPPFPVIRRQITPRNSCSQNSECLIDKTTIVLRDSLFSLSR